MALSPSLHHHVSLILFDKIKQRVEEGNHKSRKMVDKRVTCTCMSENSQGENGTFFHDMFHCVRSTGIGGLQLRVGLVRTLQKYQVFMYLPV